uniref:HMA domain-containing protein n=1 Tax=Vitis vinifera TaxID=29760 RepID=F6H1N1_VITVI
MRGLMCHSPAATAVCIPGDPRSVIVPRRPDRTLVDHSRLINNAKYSRLVESHRFTPAAKRSVLVPAMKRGHRPSAEPMPFHPPSSTPSLDHVFQVRFMIICKVVVMRVSLHCQGCAGKVKKHLSKMEGVTSFSIDLETKRVTVMGHVSPSGVLESISKVKKAELWSC